MPLVAEEHFSNLGTKRKRLDLRGPLGVLAGFASGRAWDARYRSKEATTTRLEEWYEGALALAHETKTRETEVDYVRKGMRLMKWLPEKRRCLEIALEEGQISRIDVLQQVVS